MKNLALILAEVVYHRPINAGKIVGTTVFLAICLGLLILNIFFADKVKIKLGLRIGLILFAVAGFIFSLLSFLNVI